MMDQDHWATVAQALSLGTLQELHQKIADMAAVTSLPYDFIQQARIFEVELERRGESVNAISFR